MIDSLRQYLLGVISAAIICSILSGFVSKNSTVGATIRLLAGIVLALSVISPLLKFNIKGDFIENFSAEANDAVSVGTMQSNDALRRSIKQQVQSYILDKATSLKADISVEVTLSSDDPPVPESVSISGDIGPYAKRKMTEIISEELGIPKENQLWT